MRILVFSDSHGNLDNVEKVIKRSGNIDMIIHLGDIIGQDEKLRAMCECPVKIVKGNCDFYSENPVSDVVTLGENKIFITHGHNYGVGWSLDRLFYAAQENGCNIAMYGHTHVPGTVIQEGVIIVNPGSVSRPRQLNHKPTYILMNIDKTGTPDFAINYV